MSDKREITINLENIYGKDKDQNAKLSLLDVYISKVKELAGEGNEVVLTGAAPVWLYLKALHGKAKKLIYSSPVTGELIIFDHSPF